MATFKIPPGSIESALTELESSHGDVPSLGPRRGGWAIDGGPAGRPVHITFSDTAVEIELALGGVRQTDVRIRVASRPG